jgi:hypothetical protein
MIHNENTNLKKACQEIIDSIVRYYFNSEVNSKSTIETLTICSNYEVYFIRKYLWIYTSE